MVGFANATNEQPRAGQSFVSVNCLDKPDAGGLIQILDRLASSLIAVCKMMGVWEECER